MSLDVYVMAFLFLMTNSFFQDKSLRLGYLEYGGYSRLRVSCIFRLKDE
jgi:hypothetical protein